MCDKRNTKHKHSSIPAKTSNERIMTREYASSYADRYPGDVNDEAYSSTKMDKITDTVL